MGFENPSNEQEDLSQKVEEAESKLFEIKKMIKGMEVSVNVEREGEPISGSIDLENKKVEAHITPEGIKTGLSALANFLESQGAREKMQEWTEKINASTEEIRRRRDERTINEYAEQEGMTEKEVIEDILDEFGGEDEPT